MTKTAEEIVQIFKELSPESQLTLLTYARIAYTAENAIKNSIHRALGGKDAVNMEQKQGVKSYGA